MTPQETILRACVHPTGRADVRVGPGQYVDVCSTCWNRSVAAYRQERKAQLAARPRDCARCGVRPHRWRVAGYRLCGRCKTVTMREHHQETARHGPLAIFATGLMVDTSTWASVKTPA